MRKSLLVLIVGVSGCGTWFKGLAKDCPMPPDKYETAKLAPETCFSPQPGINVCLYGDDPRKPDPCAYVLAQQDCSEWMEIDRACLEPKKESPKEQFEQGSKDFGL